MAESETRPFTVYDPDAQGWAEHTLLPFYGDLPDSAARNFSRYGKGFAHCPWLNDEDGTLRKANVHAHLEKYLHSRTGKTCGQLLESDSKGDVKGVR
jgi:hypothetical protein